MTAEVVLLRQLVETLKAQEVYIRQLPLVAAVDRERDDGYCRGLRFSIYETKKLIEEAEHDS